MYDSYSYSHNFLEKELRQWRGRRSEVQYITIHF